MKRSKFLPHGGHLDVTTMAKLVRSLKEAITFATRAERVTMTDAARQGVGRNLSGIVRWPGRTAGRGDGEGRGTGDPARSFTLCSTARPEIDVAHLKAAMSVWAYCDESATLIFGDSLATRSPTTSRRRCAGIQPDANGPQ